MAHAASSSGLSPGAGLPLGDREAELRRRNEDLDRRRSEALRMADMVVSHQTDKLVQSPASLRASQGLRPASARASVENSPVKSVASAKSQSSPASAHSRPQSAHSRFLDEDTLDAPAAAPQPAGARKALRMDDSTVKATPQMGSEATIRYLKARLAVMEEELAEVTAVAREREETIGELQARNKELEDDKAKAAKNADTAKTKVEKLKGDLQAKTKLAESVEQQLRAALREREHLEKSFKQTDSAAGVKDVRLNRALEDVERYKKLLQDTKASHADLTEQGRKQLDAAVAEKKKLAKQKTELITAFRNQLKLIDVLKRQVIHLQAAKLLDISEKDFTRALEIGEQI